MAKLLTMHASQAVSFLRGATLARARAVHCPLCDGTKHALIAARGSQKLRLCRDCGVGFLFPQPTAEQLVHHFGDSSEAKTSDPESNRRNVLAKVAKYIRNKKSYGTVLDVGCATGFFLANFFPEADWRKLATELSSVYAGQAAEKELGYFVDAFRMPEFLISL